MGIDESRGKFYEVAAREGTPNWNKLSIRESKLSDKPDDVRTPFVRDYTRVLHCLAFRRLKSKTQVFYSGGGNDHICTRIEHVMHVESVSSGIAKTLGLNEELTRSIAIAHDLGHSPFGHRGETVLNDLLATSLNQMINDENSGLTEDKLKKEYGVDKSQLEAFVNNKSDRSKAIKVFWHEKNGLRLVDNIEFLENSKGKFNNLDLTYATRDGIVCHCGEVDDNALFPRTELGDLSEIVRPAQVNAATWEGVVVKVSDKIAYLGRDIEDAIRLGYLDGHDLKALKDLAKQTKIGDEERIKRINTTSIMGKMIDSITRNSSPEKGICFSPEAYETIKRIKDFNYEYIYRNPKFESGNKYCTLVIQELYNFLASNFETSGVDTLRKLVSENYYGMGFVKEFVNFSVKHSNKSVIALIEEDKNLKLQKNTSSLTESDMLQIIAIDKFREMFNSTQGAKKVYGDFINKLTYIQSVTDFIAGMTDEYAIKSFNEIVMM
ncbi:MAG: HD domain-containing protein [Lachnospiraceae bacterium]|nr:HD domain-containing protein [Lachnospiraceae bacterium]